MWNALVVHSCPRTGRNETPAEKVGLTQKGKFTGAREHRGSILLEDHNPSKRDAFQKYNIKNVFISLVEMGTDNLDLTTMITCPDTDQWEERAGIADMALACNDTSRLGDSTVGTR